MALHKDGILQRPSGWQDLQSHVPGGAFTEIGANAVGPIVFHLISTTPLGIPTDFATFPSTVALYAPNKSGQFFELIVWQLYSP
jgi:hypothetical protein